MKRMVYSLAVMIALGCNLAQSSEVELKPHETWWQDNFLKKGPQWLGGINMFSRVKMRQQVRAKGYKTVLDIPCGYCVDYEGIKVENIPVEYQGMDITPAMVERAQKAGIKVTHASIEQIPLPDSSIDMTYSRHILEHLSYYERAIAELIRVAAKEVFIVFFIKPGNQNDEIKTLPLDGFPVYHNCYNRAKLDQYVKHFAKVDHVVWEELDAVEAVLHIYLKPTLDQSSPINKAVDFDASLAALDPLVYEGKPYYLSKLFLEEKVNGVCDKAVADRIFSCGWDNVTEPRPVRDFYNFLKKLYIKNDPSTIKPGTTYKIPRIIHQIWIQGELPPQYREWAKTWQNIPGWKYMFWTDKEIRQLGMKALDSYNKADGYGIKSDIARYEILRQYGGICLDIDFKCLQPHVFDLLNRSYDFYTCLMPLELAVFGIANGFIACAPHHPVMEAMVDFVANHYDPAIFDYLRTGPVPFSRMFWAHADQPGYTDIVFPPTFLYPAGYHTPLYLYDQYIKPETLAVHYWARSWSTKPKFTEKGEVVL